MSLSLTNISGIKKVPNKRKALLKNILQSNMSPVVSFPFI